MPDELRLSKSSLDLWGDCNYAWMLAYVHRIRGAPTLQMIQGRAAHAGIEAHWKGEDPQERATAAFAADLASVSGVDDAEAAAALLDIQGLVRTYVAKIAPTFTPTIIEGKFLIRVNGLLVSGAIDAADDNVHDTKTTSTPSKVDPARHSVEMSIYHMGYESLTGHPPGKLLLDVVGRNGRVATKEVAEDRRGTAEYLGYVAGQINAGSFEPTGARTGQCGRCAYQTICKYARV